MSDDNSLEYCPVHAQRAGWDTEQDTILEQRRKFLPEMAHERAVDAHAQHYLASLGEEPAGYLRINNADGHISAAASRPEYAADIADTLLRQAIIDTPRHGLSRLYAEANHPWRDSLLRLGFSTDNSDTGILVFMLPPDRSGRASGSELVRLEQAGNFRQFSVQLVQQAARSVVIFSDDLEAWLYDHDDFVTALLDLAQKSRYSTIRIIVRDTRALLERGHRLLRASHRASDKIQLHKLPASQTEKLPCFMVADDNGLILRPDPQIMQGIGYTDYRARAKPLLDQFEQYWARSCIDPDLRQHTV